MDWMIAQESRIARLPMPLRYPALLARNLIIVLRALWARLRPAPKPKYVFESDGLATVHFTPFLVDSEWSALYEEMVRDWFPGTRADVRWRMWVLTSLARSCQQLEGNFAEFGVYRAGTAFMLLGTTESLSGRLFLFDTFSGIPGKRLTAEEEEHGFEGRFADSSVAYVRSRLEKWQGRYEICPGDVFETLEEVETGPLVFVHMDLNARAPTQRALEYAYRRLVPGGVILFDDYGHAGYELQRDAIDGFYASKADSVIALPTGQGFAIKRGAG
jgi:hypothetical protein